MARLGDICRVVIDGDWIESKDQSETGLRLIQTGNIGIGEYLDKSSRAKFISEETFERLNCTEVFPGDILISRLPDPIGRACIIPQCIGKAITAVDCTIVRLDDSLCDDNYFINYTQSVKYTNELSKFLAGTTRTRISRKNLEKIEIPLPSLEEQREIAAVLDKVSDLIAKRRQQLEKLDFLVKARFVEMFGDPVSNPKGWMMIPLKECLTGIDNGQSFICSNQSRHYEWPAILKLSAVTYGEYRPDENKALLNISQFIKSAEIHAGDLLFTRKNTPDLVGMAAYVYHSPSNLMMPDLIFRLNTKENCAKIFLWQLINHNLFRSKIQSIASGTAKSMSNISKERLLKLKIYLPPIELQNQFSDFVEQTEKTKTSIKTSLAKLETLKKALMQEYFG